MRGIGLDAPGFVPDAKFLLQYYQKVLNTDPANLLVYWPLWEILGTNARNLEDTVARDGTYTGVTLNSIAGPDGNPAGLWDGVNDYCDIYSDSLRDAFNGAQGSVSIWAKVSGAGVWTDSITRYMFHIRGANFQDRIYIRRDGTTDNRILYAYVAGNVTETKVADTSSIDWLHFGATWDAAGDEYKAYFNGIQSGVTAIGLGIWAGTLDVNNNVIGAQNNTPVDVWDGYLAHPAFWGIELTAAQMLILATP